MRFIEILTYSTWIPGFWFGIHAGFQLAVYEIPVVTDPSDRADQRRGPRRSSSYPSDGEGRWTSEMALKFTRNNGGPSLEDSGTSRDHSARSGNLHLPLSSHTSQAGPAMVLRALHRFAATDTCQAMVLAESCYTHTRTHARTHTHTDTHTHTHTLSLSHSLTPSLPFSLFFRMVFGWRLDGAESSFFPSSSLLF